MEDAHSYPFLFLLVPIVIFGPLLGLVLWTFGVKTLFQTSPEVKERQRREKAERGADRQRRRAADTALRQTWRPTPLAWGGQVLAYGAFATVIGFFSAHPQYQRIEETQGQLKLSLNHPGQRKAECHRRSAEELAGLAPNMRTTMVCGRERWPVRVDLIVDGQPLYGETAKPAGLSGDGASAFYRVFHLDSGSHRIVARLNDTGGQGPDIPFEHDIHIESRQVLVVGFDEDSRKFFVK